MVAEAGGRGSRWEIDVAAVTPAVCTKTKTSILWIMICQIPSHSPIHLIYLLQLDCVMSSFENTHYMFTLQQPISALSKLNDNTNYWQIAPPVWSWQQVSFRTLQNSSAHGIPVWTRHSRTPDRSPDWVPRTDKPREPTQVCQPVHVEFCWLKKKTNKKKKQDAQKSAQVCLLS